MTHAFISEAGPARRLPCATNASKRFRSYKKEEKRSARKPKVAKDAIQKKFRKAFRDLVEFTEREDDWVDDTDIPYQHARSLVKDLEYDAKDVERFSVGLAGLEKEFRNLEDLIFCDLAGLLLTALVEHGHEREYVLHLPATEEVISTIGYRTTKRIEVVGDVGDFLGNLMTEGGEIIVKGNAGGMAGLFLDGGSITIEGDVADSVGMDMLRGSILVKGNAGKHVGNTLHSGTVVVEGSAVSVGGDLDPMTGGEVHINSGEPPGIDNIDGGKVFHKGKLLVDK
jgi:formylmethanofuran dehydrogenase subunit C